MNKTASPTCLKKAWLLPGVCCLVAVLLELLCWGFTVDDAWIVSRVAAHGLNTEQFSFNPGGPLTDAITPLGFAHLVASIGFLGGADTPLELFQVTRAIGLLCFFSSIFFAARWGHPEDAKTRWLWLPALAGLSLPLAAWAGAGLATAPVALMVLAGARLLERGERRAIGGAALVGAAVAWRPELAPFGGWLVVRDFRGAPGSLAVSKIASFLAPPLVVMGLRLWMFETPLPLSLLAKEPDLTSGLRYAAVTLIWGGIPVLMLLTRSARRRRGPGWAVVFHLGALVFAGGDWMPALRLTAPLYPWALMVLGRTPELRWKSWVAWGVCAFPPIVLLAEQGADWRLVTDRRERLVAEGRPAFSESKRVASVDVGWVGLATGAPVVDLGGVTDPRIAALGGGHTSRKISPGLFSDRNVDTWVIRARDRAYRPDMPLDRVLPSYWVDARLLRHATEMGFRGVLTIPIEGTPGQYVIAKFNKSLR